MTPRAIFASRLREVRDECRGLSLRQLSARLDEIGYPLDHKAIFRLERGERTASVEDLLALAAALNCPPIDLLSPTEGAPHPGPETKIKGSPVAPLFRSVRLTPGSRTSGSLVTPVITLRLWLRRGWPLRHEDDREEFFGDAPFDEEEARREEGRRLKAKAPGEGLPADVHHSVSLTDHPA
jgi:transcriptional regulator with XRE-family HTH domain